VSKGEPPIEHRFVRNLRSLGIGDAPVHLMVAFSGGLDSTVLLHLLRFSTPLQGLTLSAAHLDHGMRGSSVADAAWVRGVCAAWRIPLSLEAAADPLRSEVGAREARYAFLRRAAAETGAEHVVTAHHADDQAETVLFRVARGTGLAGLGGIPRRSASGLLRPLLPFWREEIAAYAERQGIRWREDPTNRLASATRNRIRNDILPRLERDVSPAARRNLVALAELARQSESAWRAMLAQVERSVLTESEGGTSVARPELRRYDPEIRTRVVRRALRKLGIVLDRAGTRAAVQFITDAPSGRRMHLPEGGRIDIEFDVALLGREAPTPPDEPLAIDEVALRSGSVEGRLRLGGRGYRVAVERGDDPPSPSGEVRFTGSVAVRPEDFPLVLRARRPGDRMRTTGGTKSIKRLMIEHRIPRGARARRPLLVGSDGAVHWVAGLPAPPALADAGDRIHIAIVDD
jgi:tRNA(Ile)-lysidine synthase